MGILVEKLKGIYHKYSQSYLMRLVNTVYINGTWLGQISADFKLKKMCRNFNIDYKEGHKITVVFVAQYTKVWSKLESVYEAMLKNEKFKPYILVVPEEDGKNPEENISFFCSRYNDNVIDCRKGQNGEVVSLKELEPDYVFLQRPYDQYLPKEYRSSVVSKYAKTCYIDYGYEFSKSTAPVAFERKFFRNIYMFFAENKGLARFNYKRMKRSHDAGYRKSLYCGYPAFESFYNAKKKLDLKTSHSGEEKTVIWTPRWSEDLSMGGSNFFTFKDKIVTYFSEKSGVRLIFRPHPFTFPHFVSIGKMTEKDVEDYIAKYQTEQMIYDCEPEYAENFWKSDILVTDFSSLFVEYLLTGKPIIYCDLGAEFEDSSKVLLDAMYIARTWDDVEHYLDMLLSGDDPLEKRRKQIVTEQFGEKFDTVSDGICDIIEEDYKRKQDICI